MHQPKWMVRSVCACTKSLKGSMWQQGRAVALGYLFPLSFIAVTGNACSCDNSSHAVLHTTQGQKSYMVRKELGLGDLDVFLSLEFCKQLEDCTSHCPSQNLHRDGDPSFPRPRTRSWALLYCYALQSWHSNCLSPYGPSWKQAKNLNTKNIFPENTALVELQNRILLFFFTAWFAIRK